MLFGFACFCLFLLGGFVFKPIPWMDLVRTENEVFNKTITVFMAVCQEITELKKEV
jgi:hypothetical protein